MGQPEPSRRIVRFGVYEVDLQAGELRKQGLRLKLQEKPFQVLALLLERPGEVVTREELQQRLWPDVNVDFEHSLSTAIKKLRDALSDTADNPVYIETRPGRGYRFIYPADGTPTPSPQAPAWGRTGSRWQVPPGLAWKLTAGATGLAVAVALLVSFNVGGVRERLFGPATPKIDSIAVLPLKNLMGDPEQDYFVEGMHEALTTELSKISALKVISRASAVHYKGTDKRPPQIARELGVNGLIEGSVLREGDHVRITVQLLHGPSDRHLWAESFDRELPGILALHSEVARAVAEQVKAKLTPAEQVLLARTRPVNPEAHEAYLKGRHFWERRTRAGLQKALEYFDTATRIDPSYALGYAGLADTYAIMGNNKFLAPNESYPKAWAAVQRALELDQELGEAHTTLAAILVDYEWDWEGAERAYNRALELNPGYATAHHWRAMFLSSMGRHTEAIAAIRKARSLDPLSPRINANVGLVLYLARNYEQAIEEFQRALDLFPDEAGAHLWLGATFSELGLHERAIVQIRRGVALLPEHPTPSLMLARAYAQAGKRQEAKKIIEAVLPAHPPRYVPPTFVAQAYASLGDKDQAFVWLEKGYAERSPEMVSLRADPPWEPLRPDPRFQALLRRMNFPE